MKRLGVWSHGRRTDAILEAAWDPLCRGRTTFPSESCLWMVVASGESSRRQSSPNLIKAFVFDAKAILAVEGDWNDDLMEQVSPPGAIQTPVR